jgi:hypothetical protein
MTKKTYELLNENIEKWEKVMFNKKMELSIW